MGINRHSTSSDLRRLALGTDTIKGRITHSTLFTLKTHEKLHFKLWVYVHHNQTDNTIIDLIAVEPRSPDISVMEETVSNTIKSRLLRAITGIFFENCKKCYLIMSRDNIIAKATINELDHVFKLYSTSPYFWKVEDQPKKLSSNPLADSTITEMFDCYGIQTTRSSNTISSSQSNIVSTNLPPPRPSLSSNL